MCPSRSEKRCRLCRRMRCRQEEKHLTTAFGRASPQGEACASLLQIAEENNMSIILPPPPAVLVGVFNFTSATQCDGFLKKNRKFTKYSQNSCLCLKCQNQHQINMLKRRRACQFFCKNQNYLCNMNKNSIYNIIMCVH